MKVRPYQISVRLVERDAHGKEKAKTAPRLMCESGQKAIVCMSEARGPNQSPEELRIAVTPTPAGNDCVVLEMCVGRKTCAVHGPDLQMDHESNVRVHTKVRLGDTMQCVAGKGENDSSLCCLEVTVNRVDAEPAVVPPAPVIPGVPSLLTWFQPVPQDDTRYYVIAVSADGSPGDPMCLHDFLKQHHVTPVLSTGAIGQPMPLAKFMTPAPKSAGLDVEHLATMLPREMERGVLDRVLTQATGQLWVNGHGTSLPAVTVTQCTAAEPVGCCTATTANTTKPWSVSTVTENGKTMLAFRWDSGPVIKCTAMETTIDGVPVEMHIRGNQVSVKCRDCLANVDAASSAEEGHGIVFKGHVDLGYRRSGSYAAVKGDCVHVHLADGSLSIRGE
jgi:hypothetical protein